MAGLRERGWERSAGSRFEDQALAGGEGEDVQAETGGDFVEGGGVGLVAVVDVVVKKDDAAWREERPEVGESFAFGQGAVHINMDEGDFGRVDGREDFRNRAGDDVSLGPCGEVGVDAGEVGD